MKKQKLQSIIYVSIFLAGFFSRELGIQLTQKSEKQKADLHPQQILAKVETVVDGDTLKLDNGQRIRLIGIDTPESSASEKSKRESKKFKLSEKNIFALGEQSKQFLTQFALGKKIRLEFDNTLCDHYGRTLAFVYLRGEHQEYFLNAEILQQGYGQVMKNYPNSKKAEFQSIESQAKQNKVGLWQQDDFIKLSELNRD